MKGGNTFRGLIAKAVYFLNKLKWWGGKVHANPILGDPYARQRSRIGTRATRKGHRRLKPPPCLPGTITYKDWLVRELGYDRRLADGYLYAHLNGYKIKMPMPTDLVASA